MNSHHAPEAQAGAPHGTSGKVTAAHFQGGCMSTAEARHGAEGAAAAAPRYRQHPAMGRG
jgi:hypothetical protein